MSEQLSEILNTPVVFGLVAQGHIPTIERMLDEGKRWSDIASAITWEPATAAEYYARYCRDELRRLRQQIAEQARQQRKDADKAAAKSYEHHVNDWRSARLRAISETLRQSAAALETLLGGPDHE